MATKKQRPAAVGQVKKRKPAKDFCHITPALRPLAVEIKRLKNDPENARRHDERSLQAIEDDLRQFGQQKPIVVGAGGIVSAGNGVLAAARRLGWTHIAAVRTNLKGRKLRAYAIADNRTGELSGWDDLVLAEQLRDLEEASGVDLESLGFTEQEMAALYGATAEDGAAEDGDDPAEPSGKTRPVADVNFTLGGYRFSITRKKYDRWLEKIRQSVGFDTAVVVKEIRRRLKL